MLDSLKSTDFSPYLNQTFRIHIPSLEPLETTLIEVTELGPERSSDEASSKRRPFSIVFRGPRDPIFPQSIYKIEHEAMGSLDLFLVPIGPDKKGVRYEAVFN